ncbi:hypothetical protein H312_00466 [Anncaliia algerae PRA339]|uniref:Uncharacterized protein n=1 Tax=Anncaliia algerae PRA339 TaxID=1288291 RepID=A0A059F508_9MICR|nr:hypothetical protein H312_00466 [Anncaliia algerae PRA339]
MVFRYPRKVKEARNQVHKSSNFNKQFIPISIFIKFINVYEVLPQRYDNNKLLKLTFNVRIFNKSRFILRKIEVTNLIDMLCINIKVLENICWKTIFSSFG